MKKNRQNLIKALKNNSILTTKEVELLNKTLLKSFTYGYKSLASNNDLHDPLLPNRTVV
jgi:hypothetical protein